MPKGISKTLRMVYVTFAEVRAAITAHYVKMFSSRDMTAKLIAGEVKVPRVNEMTNDEVLKEAWTHNVFAKMGEKYKVIAVVTYNARLDHLYILWGKDGLKNLEKMPDESPEVVNEMA